MYFKKSIILFFILLLPSIHAFAQSEVPIAEVVKIEGMLKSLSVTNQLSILTLNSPLYIDDVFATGEKSYARIRFADGTMITIRPDTTFKIEEYSFAHSAHDYFRLDLAKGGIHLVSGEIEKYNPNAIEIVTPAATIHLASKKTHIFYSKKMGLAFWGKGSIENKLGVVDIKKTSYVVMDSSAKKPEIVEMVPTIFNDAEGIKISEWDE